MTFDPKLLEEKATYAVPLDNGQIFVSDAVVRKVPGKRYVCRGHYQSAPVYAKLFIGKRAQVHASRDLHGVQLLEEADISTPPCLHAGTFKGGWILIFEAIEDSENAEVVWSRLGSDQERKVLAMMLATEVGRHHNAGLIQQDLYLKNFLLRNHQLLTLDGDGIKRVKTGSAEIQYRKNFAGLISKFDLYEVRSWLPDLMAAYSEVNPIGNGWQAKQIFDQAKHMRQEIARAYAEKKVMRNCTDVSVTKTLHQWAAQINDAEWLIPPALLSSTILDKMLDDPASRLKTGNTCTVASAQVAERRVVIKRYNIKSLWHGISRGWRPSRAVTSWQNAHRLRQVGILTAKPLLVMERRWGCWRQQAYFVMEHLSGVDIAEYFKDDELPGPARAQMAAQLARLMYELYQMGISHGDCKASNFLVVDGKIFLIDLDAMQQHSSEWRAARAHVRDLKRLLRNWAADQDASNMIKEAFGLIYGRSAIYWEAIK